MGNIVADACLYFKIQFKWRPTWDYFNYYLYNDSKEVVIKQYLFFVFIQTIQYNVGNCNC